MTGEGEQTRRRTYIPEDVAVGEWDTWPRVPTATERGRMRGSVGGSESRVAPGQPADGERSAPPTTPQDSTPLDPLALLTADDPSLSFVVRAALDDLLLNVIQQLQHDLNHGPATTRSKIASQFLPRIMRALDKEEDEGDKELEKLREEMEKLNYEMLHGEPKLYVATGTQTPDSDDLPIVDPTTGRTIEVHERQVG